MNKINTQPGTDTQTSSRLRSTNSINRYEKEFRDFSKSQNLKLIYGTSYEHRPIGLVERGTKTLLDSLRANLEEGQNLKEAVSRTVKTMRTTFLSIINDSPFECHYGRKPRTEIHNDLNISPNKQNVSAKSYTPQVYTFFNGSGKNDQLVVKTPRNLKENVSNNFLYQFLEKKRNRE